MVQFDKLFNINVGSVFPMSFHLIICDYQYFSNVIISFLQMLTIIILSDKHDPRYNFQTDER